MNFDIPHLMQRPGWSVQSVIDPAFAKLGGIVKTEGSIDPGAFCFLGVPFEGLLINDIGGKGGPDGLRAALSKLRPYSIDLDIDFTETNGFADLGDVEVEYMSYDTTFERTEHADGNVIAKEPHCNGHNGLFGQPEYVGDDRGGKSGQGIEGIHIVEDIRCQDAQDNDGDGLL